MSERYKPGYGGEVHPGIYAPLGMRRGTLPWYIPPCIALGTPPLLHPSSSSSAVTGLRQREREEVLGSELRIIWENGRALRINLLKVSKLVGESAQSYSGLPGTNR